MRAVLKQQALKNSEWTSDPLALWFHYVSAKRDAGEGYGDPLQCSCLENPRDEDPGGLPSMGSHRVGDD